MEGGPRGSLKGKGVLGLANKGGVGIVWAREVEARGMEGRVEGCEEREIRRGKEKDNREVRGLDLVGRERRVRREESGGVRKERK